MSTKVRKTSTAKKVKRVTLLSAKELSYREVLLRMQRIERCIGDLTHALMANQEAVRKVFSEVGSKTLAGLVGEHILVDVLQQTMLKEIPLSNDERLGKFIRSIEHAIEVHGKSPNMDRTWPGDEDIHKMLDWRGNPTKSEY